MKAYLFYCTLRITILWGTIWESLKKILYQLLFLELPAPPNPFLPALAPSPLHVLSSIFPRSLPMWIVWRPASPPRPISNQRTVENYVQFRIELQRARGCSMFLSGYYFLNRGTLFLFLRKYTVTTAVTISGVGGGGTRILKRWGCSSRILKLTPN